MSMQYPHVLHQRVDVDVSLDKKKLTGRAEIKCTVPRNAQTIGLNALGLDIQSVRVNSRAAAFKVNAYQWEGLPEAVTTASANKQEAAFASLAQEMLREYQEVLEKESHPELIVQVAGLLEPSAAAASAPAEGVQSVEATPATPFATPDTGLVAVTIEVHYTVDLAGSHMALDAELFVSSDQLRRSRSWMPCVDDPTVFCSWDLYLQAPAKHTVVASGTLEGITQAGRRTRTWHYASTMPIAAHSVAFVAGTLATYVDSRPPGTARTTVAEFLSPADDTTAPSADILQPEGADAAVTHFARAAAAPLLPGTCAALQLVQLVIEQSLLCKLPCPLYSQVFVPGWMLQGEAHCVPGLAILSEDQMAPDGGVELCRASRIALASALVQQWFGCLLVPATHADQWLVEGLQGYVVGMFVKSVYGASELNYMRLKERDAVVVADEALMPPLSWTDRRPLKGLTYSTERLHCGRVQALKATAVITMLASKCGEDAFLAILRNMIQGALAARTLLVPASDSTAAAATTAAAAATAGPLDPRLATAAAGPSDPRLATAAAAAAAGGGGLGVGGVAGDAPAQLPWLLQTAAFLRQVSQVGGFRKEVNSLSERWIFGAGCPSIRAAVCYNKRKNVLELGLKQEGGVAAKVSADRALSLDTRDNAAGVIRVLVREMDCVSEHAVFMGAEDIALHELRLATKPGARRPKRRAPDAIDESLLRSPVLYVLLDPQGEWLAKLTVLQPEAMLSLQLTHSQDVLAQCSAVRALAALVNDAEKGVPRPLNGVLSTLQLVLEGPGFFCRVRMEAAAALGDLAALGNLSPDADVTEQATNVLLRFYRAASYDDRIGVYQPLDFTDLAEHSVRQAVLPAVARARTPSGHSPDGVADLLLGALSNLDNRNTVYKSTEMRATLVEALGALAPESPAVLDQILSALDEEVIRDAATRTHCAALTCAALRSFGRLSSLLPSLAPRANALLQTHLRNSASYHVVVAAAETLMFLASRQRSQATVVTAAADIVDACNNPAVQVAALTAACLQTQRLGTMKKVRGKPNATLPAPLAAVARIHMRMGDHACPAVRHAAFRVFCAALAWPASLVLEDEVSPSAEGPTPSATGAHSGGIGPSAAPSGTTGGATAATGTTGRKRIRLRNPYADGITSRLGSSPSGISTRGGDAALSTQQSHDANAGGASTPGNTTLQAPDTGAGDSSAGGDAIQRATQRIPDNAAGEAPGVAPGNAKLQAQDDDVIALSLQGDGVAGSSAAPGASAAPGIATQHLHGSNAGASSALDAANATQSHASDVPADGEASQQLPATPGASGAGAHAVPVASASPAAGPVLLDAPAGTVVAKPEPSDGGYLAPGTAPMASDASMGAAEGSTGAGGVSVSAAPSQSAAPSHDKVKKEKKEKKHKDKDKKKKDKKDKSHKEHKDKKRSREDEGHS